MKTKLNKRPKLK